jgi:membrane associated rhomboid family serine protease
VTVARPGLPVATMLIAALCVLAFVVQAIVGEPAAWNLTMGFSLIPAVVTGERQLPPAIPTLGIGFSLASSMFLHADFWHVAGNVLFLWVFGDRVEEAMGHARFALFYLLCGLGGAGAQILSDPGSVVPVMGASGAISGVLGAYVVLHPAARVRLLLPGRRITLPVPAYAALGGWLGIQLMEAAQGGCCDSVAWWSHLGGFITGIALIAWFRRRAATGSDPTA